MTNMLLKGAAANASFLLYFGSQHILFFFFMASDIMLRLLCS